MDEHPGLGVMLCVPVAALAAFGVWRDIVFERDCGGYLKLAADANTVELAKDYLDRALAHVDRERWTEGSTALFVPTPRKDVGLWIRNLRASAADLRTLPDSASPLERTNVLMKLRETLMDGDAVTSPRDIGMFPHNRPFWGAMFVTSLVAFVGFALIMCWLEP